jgi:hypothetical protein
MISPWIGYINHRLCWHEEGHERGFEAGELDGLLPNQMRRLMEGAGFQMTLQQPFLYGLNRVYVAQKPAA